MSELRQEVVTQSAAAMPALSLGVVATAIMSITLNQVFVAVSIGFVALQASYLIWKWRKEVKDSRKSNG